MTRQTLGVIVFLGLPTLVMTGLPFFTPNGPNDEIISIEIMSFLMFGVPILLLIHAYRKCRLTANEDGLEIRGMFKTKFIEWSQISDFYYELSPSGHKSTKPRTFIEYGSSKQMLSRNFDNLPALLECIELKATNASSKKFEFKETPIALDTPQTFDYGNPQVWPIVLMALVSWLALIGSLVGPIIYEKGWSNFYASNFQIYSSVVGVLFAILTFIVPGTIPLLLLIAIPQIRRAQKFVGQQIVVSKSGIEWQHEANRIYIPWERVRNYHLETIAGQIQHVVESDNQKINFHNGISKVLQLRQLISQNAIHADSDSWEYVAGQSEDVLDRTSAIGADGKQIFHYKGRMNRAMLFGGIIVSLVVFMIPYVIHSLGDELDLTSYFFIVPLFITSLYAGLSYRLARVEITPEGVMHITPYKKTFLAWNEIQTLKIPNSKLFYLIIGENKTIRIVLLLTEPTEFKKTLTEHTGKAWDTEAEKGDFQLGQ